MNLQLLLRQQLIHLLDPTIGEFKVRRLTRLLVDACFLDRFAHGSVRDGPGGLDVGPGKLHRHDRPVRAAGGENFAAQLGRNRGADGVPHVLEVVVGVVLDFLDAFRVLVIKGFGGAECLDQVEVGGRTRRDRNVAGSVGFSSSVHQYSFSWSSDSEKTIIFQ